MIKILSTSVLHRTIPSCFLLFFLQACSDDSVFVSVLSPTKVSELKGPKHHGLFSLLQYGEGSHKAICVNNGLDSFMSVDFEVERKEFESAFGLDFNHWGFFDNRLLLQEEVDSGLIYHRSGRMDLSSFEPRYIPDVIEINGTRYDCSFDSPVQRIKGVDSTYIILPLSTTVYSYWDMAYFEAPCLGLLDWQTNEVKALDISYPSSYHEQCNGGFLTTFPVVNGSTLVVAYPASTELCVYDLATNKCKFVDVQPISFDFKVNPYDTAYKDDMNFAINYMMTETQVVGFEYHSELHCYMRFIDHHKVDDSGLNESQGTSYLQLLSNELDLIGEFRLPSGVVPVHHHLCQNGFRMSFPDSLSRANNVSRYAEFDLRSRVQ